MGGFYEHQRIVKNKTKKNKFKRRLQIHNVERRAFMGQRKLLLEVISTYLLFIFVKIRPSQTSIHFVRHI